MDNNHETTIKIIDKAHQSDINIKNEPFKLFGLLQQGFIKYMYLYDLKVNKAYRGRRVGERLIEKSKEIALEQGYRGLYTQGQDNNLGACLFYLKNGFVIGGLDTQVYTGTLQEGKKDILFYCDAINF